MPMLPLLAGEGATARRAQHGEPCLAAAGGLQLLTWRARDSEHIDLPRFCLLCVIVFSQRECSGRLDREAGTAASLSGCLACLALVRKARPHPRQKYFDPLSCTLACWQRPQLECKLASSGRPNSTHQKDV